MVNKQLINESFSHAVARCQHEQVGSLISRVVVNVHVGILRTALPNNVEKANECALLFGVVMRPNGLEDLAIINEAKKVVEVPDLTFLVERITFEIEEDVSGAWCGNCRERRRIVEVVDRNVLCARFPGLNLKLRLCPKSRQGAFRDAGNRCTRTPGKLCHGFEPSSTQFGSLRLPEAGDLQDIIEQRHFRFAHGTFSARNVMRIIPLRRFFATATAC